jgi:hypothetical protein
MTRKFLIVTALVAGVAATADAQLCAGNAPFSAGRMRVGVGAEFPEGGKVYGGEFAWGHQSGAYLGGSLARAAEDGTDRTALRFGGNAGYEMSFRSMPKLRLCPVARLGHTSGPNYDPPGGGAAGAPVESSMIDYAVGLAAGSVLPAGNDIAIVPSAALSWTGARAKVEQNNNSTTASDSWMEARLAAGIVFNRAITVAPVVTIPLSDAGGDTRFGFAASYNFGRSGGVMQQGGKKRNKR